jgi:hypothetical protein
MIRGASTRQYPAPKTNELIYQIYTRDVHDRQL